MKQALLIQDAVNIYGISPDAVAQVLEDILGDLYEISRVRDYGCLSYETLKQYHTVILAGTDWDRNGSKASAAALISYTVCGGTVLALGDALRVQRCFELNCLFGARIIGVELAKQIVKECPNFYEMDPILESEVIAYLNYASKQYPAAWCHQYGWGKVVCIAVGNFPESYLPPLRRIAWRAGTWLLNRL